MARPQTNPLRIVTSEERSILEKTSRSLSLGADQVARAKEILAVADGKSFLAAARLAGRKSSTAVSRLVVKFNKNGVDALLTRHAGGPAIIYRQAQRERIVREFRRSPDRVEYGTATWSLTTLQRTLRRAEDGLPQVSTQTIWKVLHERGFNWQKDRSWCDTGKVIRIRKSGPVEVTDPDTIPKKN